MSELAGVDVPRTRPAVVASATEPTSEPPASVEETKRRRKRPTADDIAWFHTLRNEGKSFREMHELTGFAIGTLQKFLKVPAKKAAKAKPAKVKAKVTKVQVGSIFRVAPPAPVEASPALKARLFDLLKDGHAIADIRAALEAFPV